MKNLEIKEMFRNNTDDKLNIYLSTLLAKCKDIEKENNLIALIMLILILLFYMADISQTESIQIGPLSIKDINSIKVFIPLVFAFLIFRYILISAHKAELHKIIKVFTKDFFNFNDSAQDDPLHMDDFTRTILPFSIYGELGNLSYKGKSKFGCFGAILIIPISGLALVPFILEFIWIKKFIIDFSTLNYTQKTSVILSIWILAISLYYFVHNMIIAVKENN
jgi:hypothetical protein